MSRIKSRFAELKQAERKALVTYITAADPHPDETVALMHSMVESGADILELGVPFSDPMADGPVIQAACERALPHGVGLKGVLAMVKAFRESDENTPVVLMGYLNPLEAMGYADFAQAAAEAGVDGVLTVDAPPEEGGELLPALSAAGLDAIYLIAPTTTDARIQQLAAAASGFLYYVSLKGVTGAGSLDVDAVAKQLALIKQYTDLPLGVGFGISDAESAAKVGAVADAVVVGSAIIKQIAERLEHSAEQRRTAVADFVAELRAGLDGI